MGKIRKLAHSFRQQLETYGPTTTVVLVNVEEMTKILDRLEKLEKREAKRKKAEPSEIKVGDTVELQEDLAGFGWKKGERGLVLSIGDPDVQRYCYKVSAPDAANRNYAIEEIRKVL